MNHGSLCLTERVFESISWRNSFLEVLASCLNPRMTSCSQANAPDRLLLCQLSLLCFSSAGAKSCTTMLDGFFCRIKGFNKFEAEFLEVFGQAKLTGELKVGLEQCLCLALLVDLEACLYVLQSTD